VLLIVMLAYAVANLLHYAPNAKVLYAHPNMPGWLSRAQIYTAWLGVTAIGLVGCLLPC
jgi:hypothetical protein